MQLILDEAFFFFFFFLTGHTTLPEEEGKSMFHYVGAPGNFPLVLASHGTVESTLRL